METTIIIPDEHEIVRIDKALMELLEGQSRSSIQILCNNGKITVNGKVVTKSQKVKAKDVIVVDLEAPKELEILAEKMDLNIVYEDSDLLVINKPKGMVVHPAVGNYTGTLVNGLMHHCGDSLSGINGVIRPGIVHRIDKDTSGLIIVAKNDLAHRGLSEQIQEHSFTREYEAIIQGHFKESDFSINEPIGRSQKDRKKMCVTDKNGKHAITHISVIATRASYAHIKCTLETGRTHQIRVHCAYYNHPIVGDVIYGFKNPSITGTHGQCLHAKTIGFVHPRTNERMCFTSEPPAEFLSVLERTGFMEQDY